MEDGVLSLCKHQEYPPYLVKAIDAAIVLLNQVSDLDSKVPLEMAVRLYNNVDIEFRADTKGEYGWTTASQDCIFVNQVMRDRLEMLTKRRKKDTNEYYSLVFMVAVVIVHGCANLLGKWVATSQKRRVATKIRVFREHLDTRVFKGYCRLLVHKPPGAQAHEWTRTMRVMGLAVQQKTRNVVINAQALRDFLSFVPGDIRTLGPLKQIEIKQPKVAVIHLDIHPAAPATEPPDKSTHAEAVRVKEAPVKIKREIPVELKKEPPEESKRPRKKRRTK